MSELVLDENVEEVPAEELEPADQYKISNFGIVKSDVLAAEKVFGKEFVANEKGSKRFHYGVSLDGNTILLDDVFVATVEKTVEEVVGDDINLSKEFGIYKYTLKIVAYNRDNIGSDPVAVVEDIFESEKPPVPFDAVTKIFKKLIEPHKNKKRGKSAEEKAKEKLAMLIRKYRNEGKGVAEAIELAKQEMREIAQKVNQEVKPESTQQTAVVEEKSDEIELTMDPPDVNMDSETETAQTEVQETPKELVFDDGF